MSAEHEPTSEAVPSSAQPACDEPGGSGAIAQAVPSGSSTASPGPVVLQLGTSTALPTLPDDKTVISSRVPVPEASPAIASTPAQLGQSLVGKKLEHYELIEFVGGGGMGAVFRANDTRLGRTVAVKVLSRDQGDEETIRRFRNEAQSAARLDHPNIARVHYVGEDQGWNFIVFEFIEGENLRDMVERRGPLPLEEALIVTLAVAEALAHASSRDVVHRDIKPSNVLVTADGGVKLVDMGLARLHQVESSSDDLTASGVTLGTFDYISPEQARDPRSADVRSDLYSLGCTLYFMLAGQPPFPEGTALQKLLRHNADEPPDVRLFRPDLPVRVTALLGKLLAKRPAQRPQSAGELIAEIATLAEQTGLHNVLARGRVVVAAGQQPQFWARATQAIVAVAALLAVIILVDAYAPGGRGAAPLSMQPKLLPPPKTATATAPSNEASSTPGQSSPGPTPPPAASGVAAAPASSGSSAASGSAGAADDPVSDSASGSANIGPQPILRPAGLPVVGAPPDQHSVSRTAAAPADTDPAASGLASAAISPPPVLAAIGSPPVEGAVAAALAPPVLGPSAITKVSRLIVVREPPPLAQPGAEYLRSLADACRRAAELNLSEIELAFSGQLNEPPLEVAHPQLTWRAARGQRPEIVFQPPVSLASGTPHMIRLTGGPVCRLTVLGVDLSLVLPEEPSSGWSLVSLRSGQSLELRDCVLTVQDGDSDRPAVHDQVAMILVQPRLASDVMTMEPMAAMASSTAIVLTGTIARGEATMVRLAEDVPLKLTWNQGLLVTPRRLLETTGSATNPRFFEQISLTLDNVTAACRQGLFQMKRRPGAAFQFGLEAAVNRCILLTDADSPLYDFVGVSDVTPNQLRCEGESNRYAQPDVTFLKLSPPLGGEGPRTFDLRDRGNWSMERQARVGVPWQAAPPLDRPAHELTKEDFQLSTAAPLDAGFDPVLLPATVQPIVPSSIDDPLPD
jgi:serine/threonine-protein kinase